MMSGPPGTELFISSDMFFLEVLLEPTGVVKDVKIHHEGKNEQQSCEELVACLSRGDFIDFTAQLEGLSSIYQLNADKKVKCKAFSALQSLEADLGVLAQLQTFMKEPFNLVHKSPVGKNYNKFFFFNHQVIIFKIITKKNFHRYIRTAKRWSSNEINLLRVTLRFN